MAVENNKPRLPFAQTTADNRPAQGGKNAGNKSKRKGPAPKKQVSFASVDTVAFYDKDTRSSSPEGHHHVAAKPAAPASTRPRESACWMTHTQDGGTQIRWPNGQRYMGQRDAWDMPHGQGVVKTANGEFYNSDWSHGLCVAVDGLAEVPKDVQAYRSQPSSKQVVAQQVYARGDKKQDNGAAAGGRPQKPPAATKLLWSKLLRRGS